MARKTIDKVRIQQWGLTLDKWDLISDTVALNELTVINDSTNKTIALCIGDGIKSPVEYYNNANDNSTNIFFPGIGAGYRLPVAKTSLLGGIKLNTSYFSITEDGMFSPSFISYAGGVGENGGPILELPNKHNLTIHGTLTAENVVSEEKYQIQIAGEYVDVHKRVQVKHKLYTDVEPVGGVITLPDSYDYRYTKIAVCIVTGENENETWVEIDNEGFAVGVAENEYGKVLGYYHVLDENSLPPYTSNTIVYKNFSKLYLSNQKYYVFVNEYNADPFVLEDGKYSGMRIYNYAKYDSELPEEEREVAELSVDNNGILWYSKNGLGLNEPTTRKQVALIAGYNGLAYIDESGDLISLPKIALEQMPNLCNLTISMEGNEVIYNPLINDSFISIDQNYCKAIVANGKRYDIDESLVIDLGSPVWTKEMADKLDSAVQSITFNGEKYTGNNIEFDYATYIASGTLIDVQENKGNFTINHAKSAEYKDVVGYENISIGPNNDSSFRVINSIDRDDGKTGHLMDYKDCLVNFTPLLNYIKGLEQRITNLENIISDLQAS